MMKITKRDIKFFFLGIVTMIILEFALNWAELVSQAKEGAKAGYKDAYYESTEEDND